MKKIVFYLFILTFFCGCSKDNDDISKVINGVIDNSVIVGEWVTNSNFHGTYTDITLLENKRFRLSIINKSIGKKTIESEDQGTWSWIDDSNDLYFRQFNNVIPLQRVVELNRDCMKLRNLKYNTLDTYYRVIETIELNAGNETKINYLSNIGEYTIKDIYSTNEYVASVSNDGMIHANQGGVAFICIVYDQKIVYIKIKVKSRIEVYLDKTKKNFHDLLAELGEPNRVINHKTDNISSYVYFDSHIDDLAIEEITYAVDRKTFEIAQIKTVYKDPNAIQSDKDYIKEYFHPIKSEVINHLYGEYEYRYMNKVLVDTNQGDSFSITYTNYEYYTSNEDFSYDEDTNTVDDLLTNVESLLGKTIDVVTSLMNQNGYGFSFTDYSYSAYGSDFYKISGNELTDLLGVVYNQDVLVSEIWMYFTVKPDEMFSILNQRYTFVEETSDKKVFYNETNNVKIVLDLKNAAVVYSDIWKDYIRKLPEGLGMTKESVINFLGDPFAIEDYIIYYKFNSGIINYFALFVDQSSNLVNRIYLKISDGVSDATVVDYLSAIYHVYEKGTEEDFYAFIDGEDIDSSTMGITFDATGKVINYIALKLSKE